MAPKKLKSCVYCNSDISDTVVFESDKWKVVVCPARHCSLFVLKEHRATLSRLERAEVAQLRRSLIMANKIPDGCWTKLPKDCTDHWHGHLRPKR